MKIGVNTRFLQSHKMEGFGWFTFETMKRIVRSHPKHQFVFFFDRPFDPKFIFASNVTPIVLNPPARHPILFKIWFNYSITRALKKYNCDAFISPDGYLSLRTNVPQLSVIHDLNFEHHPEDIPKNALTYLKKYFPKFAHKAIRICTVSAYSKQDIVQTYDINPDKVDVTYNGVAELFQPLSPKKQVSVREKFTQGKPYILFVGAIHKRKNIDRLITAFARLKAETKLTHQLLIVGEPMWNNEKVNLTPSLKAHVSFTGHLPLDTLAQIMAAADVFTFVSYFEGFGIPLVEAMKCGTPTLAGNRTSLPEIGGDAVLYCDPFDVDDIYQQLLKLLNDHDLQKTLSKKGIERAKEFSWEHTAKSLWDSFEKMMKAN
jgi:glycosyltransferase involved in cell wall biosynthesis